jgi:hypothetical protein
LGSQYQLLLRVFPDLEQRSRCRALQPPTLMLVRDRSRLAAAVHTTASRG